VESLPISEPNYHIAIQMLKDRFGSGADVKAALYADLRNLVPPGNRVDNIRNFVDMYTKLIGQIRQIDQNVEGMAPLLIPTVLAKLPHWFAGNLERQKNNPFQEWSISGLSEALKIVVKAEENVSTVNKWEKNSAPENRRIRKSLVPSPTCTLATGAGGGQSKANSKPNSKGSQRQ